MLTKTSLIGLGGGGLVVSTLAVELRRSGFDSPVKSAVFTFYSMKLFENKNINDKEAGERGHFVQKVDLFFKRLVPCLTSDVKILLQILFRFLLSRKEKERKQQKCCTTMSIARHRRRHRRLFQRKFKTVS